MFNLLEKWLLGRLDIVNTMESISAWSEEYLLGEILSWTWEKFLFTNYHSTS